MKNLLIAAFVLLVLVQWFVPGKMIWDKNAVVRNGKIFRFEMEPVDPADPFRGRYIVLNFKQDTFSVANRADLAYREDIYVSLSNDAAGFATVQNVSAGPPTGTKDYIKASGYLTNLDHDSGLVNINFPFNKFFLQEFKAPKAEEDFRKAITDSTKKTYALVRVLNGDAVLENVYVNDKPLVQ